MATLSWPTYAFVTCVVALPCHATTHTIDPISALIQEHSKEGTSAEYLSFIDDEGYAKYVVDRPGFPYANLRSVVLPEPDNPTRRAIARVSTPEYPLNHRDLHDMKVRDLGYTKNRSGPTIEHLSRGMRSIPGVLSLVKSGLEPDLYARAMLLFGTEHPAIVANYAIAAQILREKLASTPRTLWSEHGLRYDVLDRFVHAQSGDSMYDFDMYYLIHLLDGAMMTWDVGLLSSYGTRELPVLLRVARSAAAYRERLPYHDEPCGAHGTYDHSYAGMTGLDKRPLCFDDATDRATHSWYVVQLRDEVSSIEHMPRTGMTIAERMAAPLKASRQGWIGIRQPGLIHDAMRLEVVEAKVANQLLAEGALPYRDAFEATRRALRLSCGSTP